MKYAKRIFSVALATIIAASMFSGCGDKNKSSGGGKTLTYWTGNNVGSYVDNMGDGEALQKMQENTGITVEFVHPTSSLWEEDFNLMIASGDLTDIISYNWATKYTGGYEGAFKDGVIIDLTDRMNSTDMPYFSKVIAENPDFKKTITSTEGKMYYVAAMTNDTVTNSSMGPMIRKDWLDKLGLQMPETMEDWYNVLKAFKTQDPNGNGQADEIPFVSYKAPAFNSFAAAYGTKKDIYVKDGKVVYGSITPEFKEFVTEMNKWYKEGLIDDEYAALEKTVADANMTTDLGGATIAYVGGSMGNYLAAKKNDPNFNIVAAPWPSKTAGAPNYIATNLDRKGGEDVGSAISTDCKDVDLALRWLDYAFSDEATVLQNWGIEGKTYEKDGDEYKLTDYVLKNPDGLSPVKAISPIAYTAYGVPPKIIDAKAYSAVQYSYSQQADAAKIWSEGDRSLMTLAWPMTAEERDKVSEIKTAILTYEDEMYTKMVMGKEPVSNFDAYVAEMKRLGVDELVAVYQKAYDRFNAQ